MTMLDELFTVHYAIAFYVKDKGWLTTWPKVGRTIKGSFTLGTFADCSYRPRQHWFGLTLT